MICKICREEMALTSQGYAHSDGEVYKTCPLLVRSILSGELSVRLPRAEEEPMTGEETGGNR